MRKLILLLLLLMAGTASAQYDAIDSLNYQAGTFFADTINWKFGTKTFMIANRTAGTVSLAFDNGLGRKDTTNLYTIAPGVISIFTERMNSRMYVKSSVAGSVNIVCDYGSGGLVNFIPIATDGTVPISGTVTTTPGDTQTVEGTVDVGNFPAVQSTMPLADTSLIWASDTCIDAPDTLSKYSQYPIVNLQVKFPNRMRLDITADSSIQISTDPAFPTGATFLLLAGESLGFDNFDGTSEIYIRGYSLAGTPVGIRRYRISAKGR